MAGGESVAVKDITKLSFKECFSHTSQDQFEFRVSFLPSRMAATTTNRTRSTYLFSP